jgi:hypothetical protein
MKRAGACAIWLTVSASSLACSGGDDPPGKDTPPPEPPPAGAPPLAPVPAPAWNASAGGLFLVHGGGGVARVVDPSYTADQALDSIAAIPSSAQGMTLDLVGLAGVVGSARIESVLIDSTCAGWPAATLTNGPSPAWRVAFPAGRVEVISFDSLPGLTAADSAARVTAVARTASHAPADTAVAFRGRPFIVRQAHRFTIDSLQATLAEVVRMVPQEANPLQEQLVLLMRTGTSDPVFSLREVGLEEALTAMELLAVLRLRESGTVALLLRREQEGGYRLQWIEQARSGWRLRWQSALDGC